MADHFALLVNGLLTETTLHDAIEKRNQLMLDILDEEDSKLRKKAMVDDSLPKKLVECRICQDEDFDSCMETPCSCCGSLKYAHRRCVQRWCNEKGNTTCEICYQQFKPGYTAPPPIIEYRRIPLSFRRNFINPEVVRVVQVVQTDREEADSDYEDSPSRSLRWLAVAIIFLVLLILRHTLPVIINGPDCCYPLILLVMLRVAGFALLLYIIMLALVGLRHNPNQNAAVVEEGEEQSSLQGLSHVIQVE